VLAGALALTLAAAAGASAAPLTRDAVFRAARGGESARVILHTSFPGTTLVRSRGARMRVLVADLAPRVVVDGQTSLRLVDEGRAGSAAIPLAAGHRYEITRKARRFVVADLDAPGRPARLVGPVSVDSGAAATGVQLADPMDRRFRGALEMRPGVKNTMMVVNLLPVEQYLLGVLPGEMPPEWGAQAPQALRAGAIVLRTRALATRKLGFAPYDVTADDPLYLGLDGERSTTTQAVGASGRLMLMRGKEAFQAEFPTVAGAKPILFEPELGAPRLVALGQARPVPGARPGLGSLALQQAVAQIGTPYAWGGSRPGGFDCSGLVFYVYGKLGVRLPRVAADQAKVGAPVTLDQLAPGDAVFFADSSGYIHHMGLYVGDGKFVHAPRSGETVRIDDLTTGTYALQYAGARRYSP